MKTTFLFVIFACLLAAPNAKAVGIAWDNSLFDPLGLYTSTGANFDDSFVFELGTFGSFVPNANNLDLWASNWKLLDRAQAPAQDGWNSGFQYFSSSFNLENDGTVEGLAGSAVFSAGEQAYLWVRSGNEWALVTDNSAGTSFSDIWSLPNPVEDFQVNWNLDTADVAVFGGVNGTQSAGDYSVDPGANMRLQTHLVPEPGTAMLIFVAGCFARLRRSRRRA